ncbi:MAG: hypothetical protein KGJ62_14565 [Armatimonadetes bacterium]|nr:hypothetical protein [Armatimonadota bacterium]MDE2207291.1 hypothetical protein [Armatimonadota bacterium]
MNDGTERGTYRDAYAAAFGWRGKRQPGTDENVTFRVSLMRAAQAPESAGSVGSDDADAGRRILLRDKDASAPAAAPGAGQFACRGRD